MSSFNLHQHLYNGYKPLIGHPHDFHGYSVDTHGFGEDLDVEITELPSERRERTEYRLPPLRHSPTPPPYPFLDPSTVPTQTPARPDALTMLPPATPAPAGRVALHDLNFFPQQGFDRRGPEYLPANDFHLPRLMDDQGRAWSGETGTEQQQKQKKGKKAKKGQENVDAEAGKSGRYMYNGDDYIGFARACIDVNPWIAPHGEKGTSWEKVLTTVSAQKTFRHHGMTASTMQNKCESLVGFKKTPGDPKYKTLAKLIGNNTSEAITIGALLERMEIQYDEAKDKSDEAKAVIKKVHYQLLKEDNERRAEHEKEVSASLREYVKDSREQRGEFSSILRDLVASAARN